MGAIVQSALSAVMLGAASAAAADGPPICADRPGKANVTCTVPAGHFQLETGLADWSLARSAGERDTLLVLGATAIKYGLTGRSTVELDVTPYVRVTSRAGGARASASGFGDLILRYKQRLTAEGGNLQVSAYPFVKLPTARRALGNGKLEGGFSLLLDYAIPNSSLVVSVDPELDLLTDNDGNGRHPAMVQVASLGWQVSERLGLSGELWGQWDWDPDGTARQYSADASAAYLVSNHLQLDAGANFGLNRNTADVELYAGVSVRF